MAGRGQIDNVPIQYDSSTGNSAEPAPVDQTFKTFFSTYCA